MFRKKLPPPVTMEEKMDRILHYLNRMDRRERLRTAGAFLHGIIAIIPTAILLFTLWYVYQNGQQLLEQVAAAAARQAAIVTQGSASRFMTDIQSPDILKQLQDMLSGQQ